MADSLTPPILYFFCIYQLMVHTGRSKAQSAMEYLTTYSWAIVVIVIVVLMLFELGLFSPNSSSARVLTGSCYVERPYGPNTTQLIGLQGLCTGGLPKFVASFNGTNSVIVGPVLGQATSNSVTIAAWMDAESQGTVTLYPIDTNSIGLRAPSGSGTLRGVMTANVGGSYTNFIIDYSGKYPLNYWVFVVTTYNGNVLDLYVNGALAGSKTVNYPIFLQDGTIAGNFLIGGNHIPSIGDESSFYGKMADVQFYNTALGASDIRELYAEGIGGAPLNLYNLIGWWPLNGNAKDYSGDNNDAYKTAGVSYITQWTTGYTAP